MAILSKGTDFTTGDQVTAAKLDALVDNATFASGAVDDSTTQLDGSGRIIVKDSGITSAKLNLSATGVSQTIASFKTTQDGNDRSLDILTPASTTDLNSPFELATGNAILFQIDPDHPILFDADGKVGIGTEGPDEQLTVQTGTFGNNQDGGIAVQLGSESGSHFKIAFKCKTDGSGNPRTSIDAPLSSTGGTTQEVISINNSGEVGIGTTNPTDVLHVVGDIKATNGTQSVMLQQTGSIEIRHSSGPFIDFKNDDEDRDCRIFQDSDGLGFQVGGSSSVATRMELTSNGTVKIRGQASDGDSILKLISTSASDISKIGFGDDSDDDIGGITYNHTDNSMRFATSTSEQLRIIGSTGIAVGQTTTPTGVAGSIFCAGRIGSLDTVSQTTSDAANLFIGSDGLFKKSTSSARYKKNIEDYTKGIDALKLLRPVSFQSNNEEDGDKTYAGLIAEEVHDAGLTEFVSYNNNDEPEAIAYSNMVSLLTKALQESIAKIEALEARVNALES